MADTVSVACMLPNGLVLDADSFKDGMRVENPINITLNGGRATRDANGMPLPSELGHITGDYLNGGYGLTEVPKDAWDAWYAAHEKSDLVKNRIAFAVPKMADARKEAENNGAEKSGFEPADKTDRGIEPDKEVQ